MSEDEYETVMGEIRALLTTGEGDEAPIDVDPSSIVFHTIKPETIQRSKDAAIAKGEWAKYMREIEAEIVPGGANSIFPMLEIPRYDPIS